MGRTVRLPFHLGPCNHYYQNNGNTHSFLPLWIFIAPHYYLPIPQMPSHIFFFFWVRHLSPLPLLVPWPLVLSDSPPLPTSLPSLLHHPPHPFSPLSASPLISAVFFERTGSGTLLLLLLQIHWWLWAHWLQPFSSFWWNSLAAAFFLKLTH